MFKVVIFGFSLLFFTGCISTTMESVHVNTPEAYSVEESFSLKEQWWRDFEVEELNSLVEAALENNHDILVALERLEQASYSVDISRAKYFPDASLSLSNSQTNSKVRGEQSTTRDSLSASGRLSYEVDLWGKVKAENSIADINFRISEYDLASVQLSISSSIAAYYFDFLSINERIGIAYSNLDIAKKLLDMVEKKYQVGNVSVIDLNRQKSSFLQVQNSLLSLENQKKELLNAISLILGSSIEKLDIKGVNLNDIKVVEVGAGVPSELLKRRPDIASLYASLEKSYDSLHIAKVSRYPSFSLTGALGAASNSLFAFSNPTTLSSSFGLGLSYTLFDAGALKAQEKIALSNTKVAELEFIKGFLAALVEVENILNKRSLHVEQFTLSNEILALNSSTLKKSEVMYMEGLVDFTTVLEAQNSYFSAQDLTISYLQQYLNDLVDLNKALGGGFSSEF